MKLPRWLRRDKAEAHSAPFPLDVQVGSVDGSAAAVAPADLVRWVGPAENPFGVDVLDCSAVAGSMVAATSSPEIASRFAELRGSRGEQCQSAEGAGTVVACHLEYPVDNHAAGPVFLAQQMEDKWDVFLVDAELCFSRSWTGDVVYRARVSFDQSRAIVTHIRAFGEPGASGDPVGVVDYLMKSHVYGLIAPHPLTGAPPGSDKDLAFWSFSHYGRRGLFGTNADVTPLRVRRNDDGRFMLMRQV